MSEVKHHPTIEGKRNGLDCTSVDTFTFYRSCISWCSKDFEWGMHQWWEWNHASWLDGLPRQISIQMRKRSLVPATDLGRVRLTLTSCMSANQSNHNRILHLPTRWWIFDRYSLGNQSFSCSNNAIQSADVPIIGIIHVIKFWMFK